LCQHCIRYGTTTYVIPPHKILHAKLLGNDADKIKDAVKNANRPKEDMPMALVLSKDYTNPTKVKELLQACDLWFVKEEQQ